MSTTKSENKELVRSYMDAFNERDTDRLTDLLAEDVVRHGLGEPTHGPRAIIEDNQNFFDAFPDLTDTIEDLVAEDDRVACRYTSTGTHEGEFQGVPPTGEEVEISGLVIFEVGDGVVTEIWAQVDMLGAMQQLDVVDLPG